MEHEENPEAGGKNYDQLSFAKQTRRLFKFQLFTILSSKFKHFAGTWYRNASALYQTTGLLWSLPVNNGVTAVLYSPAKAACWVNGTVVQ